MTTPAKHASTPHNLLGDNLSTSGKRWFLREADERQVAFYVQRFGLPEAVARLLVARNIPEETLETYLKPSLKASLPDPYHLKDMDKAVKRLVQAISSAEKIAVFGDYDVDGATSSALLKRYFQALGLDITLYIPDRMQEGYGPNIPALEGLKKSGHTLVITVDCGTTSFEPLAAAKTMGLDVIVIDHHIAEPKHPEVIALINPNRLDQMNSPCRDCAAVGVVFVTLVALQKHLRETGFFKDKAEPDLLSFLDLVATGTVCDVVALKGLNRAFVKQGLKVLSRRQNIGLKALADVSGIESYPTAYHLGFLLGPRINAGGRVGSSALGAELLSCNNPSRARDISQHLSIYNEERKAIEAQVLEEALAQGEAENAKNAETPLLVVAGENWHAGVIGIVAGRLKDTFNKPTIVISLEKKGAVLEGKGSARSVPGLDIGTLIQAAKQEGLLDAGGGHAMAGGLSIRGQNIKAFKAFCTKRLTHIIEKENFDFTPALKIDARLSAGGASVELAEKFEALAPYGQGNSTPRFLFEELSVIRADIVGENHVRCLFTDFSKSGKLSGIAFRCVGTPLGDLLLNARGKWLSAVGTLSLDEWNGVKRVQFRLEDLVQISLSPSQNLIKSA
ncbi:MAG: single-stranded-DNA-specific exonuclease RecJ [Alphaproteobacteria bacterium]|nr:single-stranded-DNA-specific exonuclease RecJ [Alphaproteobacteria bacterium]